MPGARASRRPSRTGSANKISGARNIGWRCCPIPPAPWPGRRRAGQAPGRAVAVARGRVRRAPAAAPLSARAELERRRGHAAVPGIRLRSVSLRSLPAGQGASARRARAAGECRCALTPRSRREALAHGARLDQYARFAISGRASSRRPPVRWPSATRRASGNGWARSCAPRIFPPFMPSGARARMRRG